MSFNVEKVSRHIGSKSQIAELSRVKNLTTNDNIWLLNNGLISCQILENHALDLFQLSYKNQNMSYITPQGLNYSPDTYNSSRSYHCGMMFTCGVTNSGPAQESGDNCHGRIRNISAQNICAKSDWQGNEYVLHLSGEMRQAALFEENLLLKRTITSTAGANLIKVRDVLKNEGFSRQQIMMMYHINVGYPMLSKGAKLYANSDEVIPRDEEAKKGIDNYSVIDDPVDDYNEQVFFHKLNGDKDNIATVMLVNAQKDLGLWVKFSIDELPCFTQWKSMKSGSYALGIEPGNCLPIGAQDTRKADMAHYIDSGETYECGFELGFAQNDELKEMLKTF